MTPVGCFTAHVRGKEGQCERNLWTRNLGRCTPPGAFWAICLGDKKGGRLYIIYAVSTEISQSQCEETMRKGEREGKICS